jgi:hypothetical protein
MLNVYKKSNMNEFDQIDIVTEDGSFSMLLKPNSNLYWRYNNPGNGVHEIMITKEDYFLYRLFEDAYNLIMTDNPYENERKKMLSYGIPYNSERNLVNGNSVKWYSDEYSFVEQAPSVSIQKYEEAYGVTFNPSNISFPARAQAFNYMVSFKNEGSRYLTYSSIFFNMMKKMQEHDFENHQMHIEEYLYECKKRKLEK